MFDYEKFDTFEGGGLNLALGVALLLLALLVGGVGVWILLLSSFGGGEAPPLALLLLMGGALLFVLGLLRLGQALR